RQPENTGCCISPPNFPEPTVRLHRKLPGRTLGLLCDSGVTPARETSGSTSDFFISARATLWYGAPRGALLLVSLWLLAYPHGAAGVDAPRIRRNAHLELAAHPGRIAIRGLRFIDAACR